MVALRTSLAALFLVLGACDVGEVPSGGGSAGTPDAGGGGGGGIVATEAGFNAKVKPLIEAKSCAVSSCHGGIQVPNLTSFTALPAAYKTPPGNANKLVNHVAAGAPHGLNTWFSTTEMNTVAAWIDGN